MKPERIDAARGRPIVRHLAFLAVGAAAPFAALTIYLATDLLARERETAHQEARRNAEATAATTVRTIGRARLILDKLANREAIAALDPTRCDPMPREVLTVNPLFTNVFTVNLAGSVVCSALPIPANSKRSVDPESYLAPAKARRQFVISKPAKGVVSGKWIVLVAQPVLSAGNEVIGVVAITIDLVGMAVVINKEALPPDTVVTIIDSDATILTRYPDPEAWVGRSAQGSEIARVALTGKRGTTTAPGLRGYERLWAFEPIPDTPWTVMAGRRTEVVLASVYDTMKWIAALAAVSIGLVVVLCMLIARPIARPIAAMAAAARRMTAGNVLETISPDGPREIKDLAEDFNHMMERRVAAEQELRQSETRLTERVAERTAELEESNRELAAFDYSISHDLRAPLNRIMGFTQFLAEDSLPPDSRTFVERIESSAVSMNQLITDMLSLSTMARGDVHRSDVDISAMSRVILESFQRTEPSRSVQLDIASSVQASADPGLMRIVLENLLGNAWKFTSRREDARIEVGCDIAGDERRYFVRDNGAGFDASSATKLFEPFRRQHSQSEFRGTGIGLATVQRIVRRHGGRIWAQAAIGQGATFSFVLSSRPAHAQPVDEPGSAK